ncbi:MAG: hypothetical protein CM15mP51_17780 [Porticoccaceae bacterium]|nr:MAG: hypothetical protein CM15mP51_17780 [Porticoccaceae bacterium]
MIVWVDSKSSLLETFDKLIETSVIGLDTEFIRTNTFFPKLALLQISDGNDAWLIDVLSINDLSVFSRFFESSEKKICFAFLCRGFRGFKTLPRIKVG